ncbi:unnamed protein product (macronuclear) [Paramecium tetraurelia]|uniref:Uncharacterized protein n=1 Tax=Paramecium tetraurelia TaxID=5888 RepID=A0BSK6_PARTE|nr:uncharacterized protein GSPATT00031755001 [Paramecium tetraurelia]CAK61523.1 unnamed protein product [Paramecium tetraurelia]|eukprot:XP_001428921.1 hypothetical protein (macronuclear) [Paramecium tetraurelia strain d4-2]
MISEIIVDGIVKQIIHQARKLIREHQIDAKIPAFLKCESMHQIKSAINLYQIDCQNSSILLDDQEYNLRPTIDSFQALTLKLIDRPIIDLGELNQNNNLSDYSSTNKSIVRRHSLKKKIDVQVTNLKEQKPTTEITQQDHQEIYKKQMNTNNNNRHSLIMKQQIRDQTNKVTQLKIENMFIDNFDPNEFRKKIQQQAENLVKEIKQCDRSFQIKKVSDKSIDTSNYLNQTEKPTTAPHGQRRPQYIINNKVTDLNATLPQFKRQLTPVEHKRPSKVRNASVV